MTYRALDFELHVRNKTRDISGYPDTWEKIAQGGTWYIGTTVNQMGTWSVSADGYLDISG